VGDKSTSAGVAVRRHAPSDGTESVRHITPQNMRTAVCDEAVKTDEPKHNIRADAKWVHMDCPPIPPGPRWYETLQARLLEECAQRGHVPVSIPGAPAAWRV
jgi:hypothetical protein